MAVGRRSRFAGGLVAVPNLPALRDLLHAAATADAGQLGIDRALAVVAREFIALLDQQPVVLAVLATAAQADQRPAAVQPLAVQLEGELAVLERRIDIVMRLPGAAVPQHHRAAAIFALGDRAFERTILDRMVLYVHGQPLVVRIFAWAFGHRPA